MNYEQRLEVHYPLHVLVRDHRGLESLHEELFALILALRGQHAGTAMDAVHMRQCTTQGGFQTGPTIEFLDQPVEAVRHLRDRIVKPAIDEYLATAFSVNPLGVAYSLHSWANILRPGDWQAPHMHPTEFNIISGVYYVRADPLPEPEGWLEFINPHPISTMHGGTSSRRHRPVTGQLLLFPPYYMHFVHPFRQESERAVVAFDVRLKAPGAA